MTQQDSTIQPWFAGQIPDDWFEAAPKVSGDQDEIYVVGTLSAPKLDADASDDDKRIAAKSRIDAFREETRGDRMAIARHAEHRFGQKVSWGVTCGSETVMFTTFAAPAMTRLRLAEREVLDTLIDAGVARSRSEALMWCVRLVGQHEADWLEELRAAIAQVKAVRGSGPRPVA